MQPLGSNDDDDAEPTAETEVLIEMGNCDESEPDDDEPGPSEKKKHRRQIIFADFEATQDKQIGENKFGPIWQHEVNYGVAQQVCDR